jgi:DNA-binding FadR family transcriptional regulator
VRQTLETVTAELRAMALAAAEGEFIGREEGLVSRLGASRATIRQSARLLEREGLLSVRRGLNGGYFASRPSLDTVEAIASAYLQSIHVSRKHINMIASVLWIEVMREAAELRTVQARELAKEWIARIDAMPLTSSFTTIIDTEKQLRTDIFSLIDARYVELIFHINSTLGARGAFVSPPKMPQLDAFLRNWRGAKLGELQAIIDGDPDLAAIAARHSGNVLQGRNEM